MMKRIFIVFIAALAIAGAASAQAATSSEKPQAQIVTVSGKLELVNALIALKSEGTTYFAPKLRMLVGFVKEIQEGATVTLEGYAYPMPKHDGFAVLALTKVTVGDKSYDLSQIGPFGGKGMRGGMRGRRGGMGGGMWGSQDW